MLNTRDAGGADGLEKKWVSDLAPLTWEDCIAVHCNTLPTCVGSVVSIFVFFHAMSSRETRCPEKGAFRGGSAPKLPGRFPWTRRALELPSHAHESMPQTGTGLW